MSFHPTGGVLSPPSPSTSLWYSQSHLGWHFQCCFKAQSSSLSKLKSLKSLSSFDLFGAQSSSLSSLSSRDLRAKLERKEQSSRDSFHWNVAKDTFKLWALSFRKCYPKDWLYISMKIIHMCDTSHSNVWHDSFIRVTWLIHMCDMTNSFVWHDSLTSDIHCTHAATNYTSQCNTHCNAHCNTHCNTRW